MYGPVDRVEHAAGDRDGRLRIGVADEHRELVAAEPSGEILGAARTGQAAGELAEELVTGAVPPRVVDRLEAVEVEVENGRRPGVALELGVHGF